MAPTKSIYGLFPGPGSADHAMAALRAAGVRRESIVVMSPEPFEEFAFAQSEPATAMPWIVVLGGLVGAIGGYVLAWYTQTAYPIVTGGMPIVAPWPTGIVTYEVTMMGAIITTVITFLVSARLPKWKPALYDPEVSHGKILIGVTDPSRETLPGIEECLRKAGAAKVRVTG